MTYKKDVLQVRPKQNGVFFAEQFMPLLEKEIGMNENSNILHLFCGKSKIGDTCDIIPFVNPKHNIDCCDKLPFEDESYDYVIADPPYDLGIKNITDTFKPYSWIPEAIRVLKTGGYLVILDSLNYKTVHPLRKTHLIGVDTGPNLRARWLIIFIKDKTLLCT